MKHREILKNILGLALLLGFVVLFITGIYSGEAETVMKKATNICLECIGID